jgi:hypothetical protein
MYAHLHTLTLLLLQINWEGMDSEAAAIERALAANPLLRARFRALLARFSSRPLTGAFAALAHERERGVARRALAEAAWSRRANGRFFWAWRRRVQLCPCALQPHKHSLRSLPHTYSSSTSKLIQPRPCRPV